jgi:hypothetical protein
MVHGFPLSDNIYTDAELYSLVKADLTGLTLRLNSPCSVDSLYVTEMHVYVVNEDIKIKKLVSGSWTILATEAVNLSNAQVYAFKFECVGSNLRYYRDGVLKLTATDTDITSGGAGIGSYEKVLGTHAKVFVKPYGTDNQSLTPIAYFEIPIIGSGTYDDPYRPQIPEEIIPLEGNPEKTHVNVSAVTYSALIPTDSKGKPVHGTCVVRLFERSETINPIKPLSKCIENIKSIPGVRRLDRDEAIRLALQMDDKLSVFDVTSIKNPEPKQIRDARDFYESTFGIIRSEKLIERYLKLDKSW